MSHIDFKDLYDNPQTMIRLMEDLEKCGFQPEFTFEDRILKLIIKKSTWPSFF